MRQRQKVSKASFNVSYFQIQFQLGRGVAPTSYSKLIRRRVVLGVP